MKSKVGKGLNPDGFAGNQCVDVIKVYDPEVVGKPAQLGNAIDYWTKYNPNFYTRVPNTPSGIPPVGSVIIWGSKSSPGWDKKNVGTYGHIAVVNSANTNQFEAFEQNWPGNIGYWKNGIWISTDVCHYRMHNYTAVKGWLIPKKDVNTDWAALEAARKAAEEAALIAKQAEDARIAAEAAEVARKAQEEADRLAADKAEADRLQREQAAKEKAEQERLAKEQAKLEEELKAKQEAEKIIEEGGVVMSPKYSLNKNDVISVLKGIGIMTAGTALVALGEAIKLFDFNSLGEWSQLALMVAGILAAALVNVGRKFLASK
jgi:surface antigen